MMVEFTIQLSNAFANRLAPIRQWLPTILELSLVGFKTPAAITATEIIAFLSGNPSPEAVFHYHVSQRAQKRLRHLLAVNAAGQVSPDEDRELDEIEKIEHIMIMLKAHLAPALYEK
jgi:hypothetical protein